MNRQCQCGARIRRKTYLVPDEALALLDGKDRTKRDDGLAVSLPVLTALRTFVDLGFDSALLSLDVLLRAVATRGVRIDAAVLSAVDFHLLVLSLLAVCAFAIRTLLMRLLGRVLIVRDRAGLAVAVAVGDVARTLHTSIVLVVLRARVELAAGVLAVRVARVVVERNLLVPEPRRRGRGAAEAAPVRRGCVAHRVE